MTEIPEHLLKRAQARRAALSGAEAPADAPAAAAPAASEGAPVPAAEAKAPAAPAPLPTLEQEEAQAKPDIPVVAAAKRRRKVPYWAAPVLALLPVWGLVYRDATIPPPSEETNPITIGSEVFAVTGGCAGCHGGDGAGSSAGAQLNDGHVLDTFNDPLQMVHWVAFGAAEGGHPGTTTYGVDTKRDFLTGGMPAFKDQLSARELASVVIYVRSQLSGDAYDPANEQGFTAENFEADPAAYEAQVEAVIEKGPGGEPDLSDIERPGAE